MSDDSSAHWLDLFEWGQMVKLVLVGVKSPDGDVVPSSLTGSVRFFCLSPCKGGAGFLSQGQAKKLKLSLCARIPKKKVVDQKKLKIWPKTQDVYRLTSFFSSPACGRRNRSSTLPKKRSLIRLIKQD